MIELHGTFTEIGTADIVIIEGPDKDWQGIVILYENQKGIKMARRITEDEVFPSGQKMYLETSFRTKGNPDKSSLD